MALDFQEHFKCLLQKCLLLLHPLGLVLVSLRQKFVGHFSQTGLGRLQKRLDSVFHGKKRKEKNKVVGWVYHTPFYFLPHPFLFLFSLFCTHEKDKRSP